MNRSIPTYSGTLTTGETIHVQIHHTRATRTGRIAVLACAMDGLPTFYTVAAREHTGAWTFQTPDLTKGQMQAWHRHQVAPAPCPPVIAEWLTELTTTPHQPRHAHQEPAHVA